MAFSDAILQKESVPFGVQKRNGDQICKGCKGVAGGKGARGGYPVPRGSILEEFVHGSILHEFEGFEQEQRIVIALEKHRKRWEQEKPEFDKTKHARVDGP